MAAMMLSIQYSQTSGSVFDGCFYHSDPVVVLEKWKELWRTKQIDGKPVKWARLQKGGKWNGRHMLQAHGVIVPDWTPDRNQNADDAEMLGEFYIPPRPETISVSVPESPATSEDIKQSEAAE